MWRIWWLEPEPNGLMQLLEIVTYITQNENLMHLNWNENKIKNVSGKGMIVSNRLLLVTVNSVPMEIS